MSLDIRSSQYRPLDSAYLVSSLIVPERDSFPTKCVAFWFYMAADTGASHQLGMLRVDLYISRAHHYMGTYTVYISFHSF